VKHYGATNFKTPGGEGHSVNNFANIAIIEEVLWRWPDKRAERLSCYWFLFLLVCPECEGYESNW